MAVYTPSPNELAFAETHARWSTQRIGFLVLLKTFQRLGYFQQLANIPSAIVRHITISAGFELIPDNFETYDNKTGTRARHCQLIRSFLNVMPYGDEAQEIITDTMMKAATSKDDIADIFIPIFPVFAFTYTGHLGVELC